MVFFYNALLLILIPFWVPWMVYRALRRKDPVDWSERMGAYQVEMRKDATRLWIHAVSVGEVISATPMLRALRGLEKDFDILLTTTTSSGHKAALGLPEGLVDHVAYFPIDVPRFVLRAMLTIKPHAVLVMETELWLNFLWTAKQFEVKTAVVNGRISDRAFPRMKSIRPYYQSLFRYLDRVWTQTERDRQRFAEFGARDVKAVGNCKFDQIQTENLPDGQTIRKELEIPAGAHVLVVGSTRGTEEESLVIEAVKLLRTKDVFVIHAPRHLETADDLAAKVKQEFGEVARRSKGQTGRYLILDTYGELASVYAAADVAVVGGAFEDLGGQNIIQPLALGKPVIHGPNIQNFRDVADLADRASAAIVCTNAQEVAYHLDELFGDENLRRTMGDAGADLVKKQQGVSEEYARLILELLEA
jgi:3-deoxy-D-manno-octulosonic-acid transferase